MEALLLFDFRRIGKLPARLIHAAMRMTAFNRVRGFGPLALHPFQVGQARAVLVFVDHARGQQRHVPGEFGEGQGKIGLRRGAFGHEMVTP